MFGKIKAAIETVSEKAGDLLSSGVDKLKATLDGLSAASPFLAEVGYRLTGLELELSLSPRIIVHVAREAEATDEAFEACLATHRDYSTFCTVVRLLRKANQVNRRLQPEGKHFRGAVVELGITPEVRLCYTDPDLQTASMSRSP